MLIIFLILASLCSFFLTMIIRKVAIRKNILDIPNHRSSHKLPTPRGGGLAIVITWFITITIMWYNDKIPHNLFYALLSGIPLIIISIIDDIRNVKPYIRIIFQTISVILGIYFIKGMSTVDLGFFVVYNPLLLSIIAIPIGIWFVNLFNFLDGIDAFATIEAMFIGLTIYLFTDDILLLFFTVILFGFLIWNWPKAKIFLGDVGSTYLGFTLFIIAISSNNSSDFNIIFWLNASSIFWFDGTVTLLRRWKQNEHINEPHKKHAYQRAVQYGFSHKKVVISTSCINLIILLNIYVFKIYFPQLVLLCSLITLLINILAYLLIEKLFPFNNVNT